MDGPQRPSPGLNENYARELMELHTMGVDSGYTQKDIVEVARAFTGWTIADPRGYRRAAANDIKGTENRAIERLQRMEGVPDDLESGQFYFNERWHDKNVKTVLSQKVNEGGIKDGLKVIDILARHPATAKFTPANGRKFVSASRGCVAAACKLYELERNIKTRWALFTTKNFARQLPGKDKDAGRAGMYRRSGGRCGTNPAGDPACLTKQARAVVIGRTAPRTPKTGGNRSTA